MHPAPPPPEAAPSSGPARAAAHPTDRAAAADRPTVVGGPEPVRPQPLTHGSVLAGRYRIGALLGSGGMADVHRAHDVLLDREVAVKVFRGPGEQHAGRQREMRLLARFSHPGLVAVYDAGSVRVAGGHRHFLVLELVPGDTLARRLQSGPLPAREAARMGADVADALAFVHAAGVVHRDVKPANILLPPEVVQPGAPSAAPAGAGGGPMVSGWVRLADFGIARSSRDHPAATVGQKGTPGYLSPEQVRGAPLAPASDVYALGLVLLESLTGRRAFTGTPEQQALARTRSAPPLPDRLSVRWRELLVAMTALDPRDRPSADQVVPRLRALAARPVGGSRAAAS